MDPVTIIAVASELGKLGLSAWFMSQRMAGKTPEQITEAFNAEFATFQASDPDSLTRFPEEETE